MHEKNKVFSYEPNIPNQVAEYKGPEEVKKEKSGEGQDQGYISCIRFWRCLNMGWGILLRPKTFGALF